jgi:hypothetical protein
MSCCHICLHLGHSIPSIQPHFRVFWPLIVLAPCRHSIMLVVRFSTTQRLNLRTAAFGLCLPSRSLSSFHSPYFRCSTFNTASLLSQILTHYVVSASPLGSRTPRIRMTIEGPVQVVRALTHRARHRHDKGSVRMR